jgi:hypothetical protein
MERMAPQFDPHFEPVLAHALHLHRAAGAPLAIIAS